jgi:hypothetical protein
MALTGSLNGKTNDGHKQGRLARQTLVPMSQSACLVAKRVKTSPLEWLME